MQRARKRIETWRPRERRYDTDPIKRKAQQRVRDAVRFGKIVKPTNCELSVDKRRLEGHHYNGYENVFDLAWLCRECHAFVHTKP